MILKIPSLQQKSFMANRGKPWLPKHDMYLIDNADQSNTKLAEFLERSALAIECHRSILAIDLNTKSEKKIDECIARLHADTEKTKRFMAEKNRRERFNEQMNKRFKMPEQSVPFPPPSATSLSDTTDISAAAGCIRENHGDLLIAWANPTFVPIMIKYISGFEAYAAAVRKM